MLDRMVNDAVEEVTVLQMEIPNFQIDQATSLQEEVYSHQTRREGEVRDREDRASLPVSTPSAEDDVMEEDSTVDVLVYAKLEKMIIHQKKAFHERMKRIRQWHFWPPLTRPVPKRKKRWEPLSVSILEPLTPV